MSDTMRICDYEWLQQCVPYPSKAVEDLVLRIARAKIKSAEEKGETTIAWPQEEYPSRFVRPYLVDSQSTRSTRMRRSLPTSSENTTVTGTATPLRQFVHVTSENALASNLTELDAVRKVDAGFMTRNDWVAHVSRYAHVGKYLVCAAESGREVHLLDVGCGRLNGPLWFWRNKIKVAGYYGIDLRAREPWLGAVDWKVPIHLAQADIVLDRHKLVQKGWPAEYDIVCCFEAFEHVPRSAAPSLAKNLFLWTKPGGICFFSTPNAGVSASVAENHTGPDGEVREWKYRDKLDLMTQVGFAIEATFGTYIGLKHLPKDAYNSPVVQAAKQYLHYDWFTVFAAAAYPELSTNSLFVMRRPGGEDPPPEGSTRVDYPPRS